MNCTSKQQAYLRKNLFSGDKLTPNALVMRLSEYPSGQDEKEVFHWVAVIRVLRSLAASSEYGEQALEYLNAFVDQAEIAVLVNEQLAKGTWAEILEQVQAMPCEREELQVFQKAYFSQLPGFEDGSIEPQDEQRLAKRLLLEAIDRKAVRNVGPRALQSKQPIQVVSQEKSNGDDIILSRNERRLASAFDTLHGQAAEIVCLADLLVPNYQRWDESHIDGKPIDADMMENAQRSVGSRFHTGSVASEAAQNVFVYIRKSVTEELEYSDIVARHTTMLAKLQGDPAAFLARVHAQPGAFPPAERGSTTEWNADLVAEVGLPGMLGSADSGGSAESAQQTGNEVTNPDRAMTIGTTVLATLGCVYSLLLLMDDAPAGVMGFVATGIVLFAFRVAPRTKTFLVAGGIGLVLVFLPDLNRLGGSLFLLSIVALITSACIPKNNHSPSERTAV